MDRLVRITKTVNDFGLLLKESEVSKFVKSDAPYFKSLYYYPEDVLDYFKLNNHSIKGYKGKVYTTEITFDIDSKDLEVSRDNTMRLLQYLEQQGLYTDFAAKVAFSGSKGFHVHINTEHTFYPKELKEFCLYITKQIKFNMSAGFKIDPTIYNTNRIFRVPNTPHEKSGLFKVEMLSNDLITFTMDQIIEAAKVPQETYPYESAISADAVQQVLAHLPKKSTLANIAYETPTVIPSSDKPCIVALQSGDMKDGESNSGLLRLANHYRQLGYSKEDTRVKLIEAAANREVKHPGTNTITLDKINQEILYSIFNGDGYTFTCSDWMLQDKCGGSCQRQCAVKPFSFNRPAPATIEEAQAIEAPKQPETPVKRASFRSAVPTLINTQKAHMSRFTSLDDTAKEFATFAKDSKKFRVETGIKALDDKVRILPNGLTIINARSGVGKSTLMLNMLSDVSRKGQRGVLYQIDMSSSEWYTKLASKELRISPDEAVDLAFSDDPELEGLKEEAEAKVKASMANILMDYEGGLSVERIEGDLIELIKLNQKPSVIFIDYIQKMKGATDYAKAADTLIGLKELVNRYKVCIVALSQIPRAGGTEETPTYTAAAAQGGAIYEQNASICINMWRPLKFAGATEDNVMGFAVSKNRMGECFDGILHFNGMISEIRDLTEQEKSDAEVSLAAYAAIKAEAQKKRGNFR